MALYDNKYWLLSHIRNSFLSTDDTGMCELIMSGENRKHLKETYDLYPDIEESEEDDDDDDLFHESFEIPTDFDYRNRHHHRADNTRGRSIENKMIELQQRKKSAARVKHIKWETCKSPLPQEEMDQLFVKKEVSQKIEPIKSLLSANLAHYEGMPSNPFIRYAKFDGSGQVDNIKSFKIFLTMLPEEERNYPIQVTCSIANAKIVHLIGLILLLASSRFTKYSWRNSVGFYSLYIMDEDGEVDKDLPCIEKTELVSKFFFNCLGLVQHDDYEDKIEVKFDDEATEMSTSYSLSDRDKSELTKIDEEKITNNLQMIDVHNKTMEAPLYRSYKVYWILKKIHKVEVQLGISGEKIEIDPCAKHSKFSLIKVKSVNHPMESLALAEILDVRSSRATFKVVYGGADDDAFKHYEFEAEVKIAEEIVGKINFILQLCSSPIRREYLASKERKFYRK